MRNCIVYFAIFENKKIGDINLNNFYLCLDSNSFSISSNDSPICSFSTSR